MQQVSMDSRFKNDQKIGMSGAAGQASLSQILRMSRSDIER